MAVRQGFGKVVTDGLVFAYDTGDTVNSYKGEPTTNLVGNSTFIGTNGTQTQGLATNNWVFSGFTGANGFKFYDKDTSPIPLKFPNEQAVITTGPNSTSNRRIYFRRTDLQPNTTYAISCWMYFSRRWSNSWSKFQYDSGGAGISLASEYFGSFEDYATARGIGLDEWFKWEGTLTTESNTAQCYWGPVISRTHDVLVGMQRMQVEVKDHVTPFVKGSRSVSGSLLDLTGTRSLDVTNVSFDDNAQPTFNGSNNRIYLGQDLGLQNASFSVEALVYWDGDSTDTFFGYYDTVTSGTQRSIHWRIYSSGQVRFDFYANSINSATGAIVANTWYHLLVTYDSTSDSCKCYRNGELLMQGSAGPYLGNDSDSKGYVGAWTPSSQPFGGEVPIFKLYNRALTEGEVKQNFAMYKKRFNI